MKWILTLWLLCLQSSLKVNLFVFLTSLSVGCLHFYWCLWFPAWVCHDNIFYTEIWIYYSWYFPWILWVCLEKENEKGRCTKKGKLVFETYVQLEKCPAPIRNIYKILSFKKMNFLPVVHANCAKCMQLLPEWPSEYSKSTKQLCCCFDSIVILWIFNSLGLRLPSPHSVTLIISDKCRLRFYDHYLKPMLEWEKIYFKLYIVPLKVL